MRKEDVVEADGSVSLVEGIYIYLSLLHSYASLMFKRFFHFLKQYGLPDYERDLPMPLPRT
jgi:hypothetical protein